MVELTRLVGAGRSHFNQFHSRRMETIVCVCLRERERERERDLIIPTFSKKVGIKKDPLTILNTSTIAGECSANVWKVKVA